MYAPPHHAAEVYYRTDDWITFSKQGKCLVMIAVTSISKGVIRDNCLLPNISAAHTWLRWVRCNHIYVHYIFCAKFIRFNRNTHNCMREKDLSHANYTILTNRNQLGLKMSSELNTFYAYKVHFLHGPKWAVLKLNASWQWVLHR